MATTMEAKANGPEIATEDRSRGLTRELSAICEERIAAGVAERLAALKVDIPAAVAEAAERAAGGLPRAIHDAASAHLDANDAAWAHRLAELRDLVAGRLTEEDRAAFNNAIDSRPSRAALNEATLRAMPDAPDADASSGPAIAAIQSYETGCLNGSPVTLVVRRYLGRAIGVAYAVALDQDLPALSRALAGLAQYADTRCKTIAARAGITAVRMDFAIQSDDPNAREGQVVDVLPGDLPELTRSWAAVAAWATRRYLAVADAYAAGLPMPTLADGGAFGFVSAIAGENDAT